MHVLVRNPTVKLAKFHSIVLSNLCSAQQQGCQRKAFYVLGSQPVAADTTAKASARVRVKRHTNCLPAAS